MCRTYFTTSVAIIALIAGGALSAMADDLPLRMQLNSGDSAEYGVIHVQEDDGGLLFEVEINLDVMGGQADLHRLYFNLHQPTNNLSVETMDSVAKPYTIQRGNRAIGGGGAFFDWSVDFGSGSGKKGNGAMHHARFRVTGDSQSLVLEDVIPMSTSKARVSVQMATHVQNSSVETVGGVFEADSGDGGGGEEVPGDEEPPPDPGTCTWVIDLMTGEMTCI